MIKFEHKGIRDLVLCKVLDTDERIWSRISEAFIDSFFVPIEGRTVNFWRADGRGVSTAEKYFIIS